MKISVYHCLKIYLESSLLNFSITKLRRLGYHPPTKSKKPPERPQEAPRI